jgi:DNA-damage-inducible protein J
MDSELVRFRVDPEIRDQAAKVCADLGFELNDVLRALLTRIARDGVLPFDFSTPGQSNAGRLPFYDYDERLWASMKPQIDAEVALALLARFIANCSTRIDEEGDTARPDRPLIAQLTQERDEARKIKADLNVADGPAVRQVLDQFGPLVRAGAH